VKKKLKGTTLIYDASEQTYLRTEIYMSDDPSETVELCVIDDEHPKFSDDEIDDSSGPWRRIIEPRRSRAKPAQTAERDEPFVLEKKHRKTTPSRKRTPTKVLTKRPSNVANERTSGKEKLDKPVWVRFEAEVLGDDGLLRVPERLHFLAKAGGDRVEVRMRLTPDERPVGATETLDGLPAIGRDQD
jgi:hypothetical protein